MESIWFLRDPLLNQFHPHKLLEGLRIVGPGKVSFVSPIFHSAEQPPFGIVKDVCLQAAGIKCANLIALE